MSTIEKEWVNLLAEVFERLTAKHTSISYDFDGVTFEADRVDSEGKYLPTGRVRISGKIAITVGWVNGFIMGIDLPINLLKLVKAGSLDVSENQKRTMTFSFDKNKITVDILDPTFNISTTKGIFTRLSEAREFAKRLNEKNLTLCISHKGKIIMKLGKEAKPKLSRMITRSGAVEITDLRELRKLDKRLRLK